MTASSTPSRPTRPSISAVKTILLIGNPNTGKSTLFNQLTGLNRRVGNYPGVTIDVAVADTRFASQPVRLIDVPGTYSLSAKSLDEMLAVELMLNLRPEHPKCDAVVCVVDASNLERNLYLFTQVVEAGVPVVIALNMVDVAQRRGIKLDHQQLAQILRVPVVPIQANNGKGMDALRQATVNALATTENLVPKPQPFLDAVDKLGQWCASQSQQPIPHHLLLERALLDADGQCEKELGKSIPPEKLSAKLAELRDELKSAGVSVPGCEPLFRYRWIKHAVAPAISKPAQRVKTWTERVDSILLHKFWGLLIFLFAMLILFQSIFAWAVPIQDAIEAGVGQINQAIKANMPVGALRALLMDGVVAGVGNVLVFLPQILILFGFLTILEDSGYMARAAFLMDRLMRFCGLSGKSFIPLLSSFACAIPGIMGTRTISNWRDRLATILVAPLMSCSARLPVYTLLVSAFIPSTSLISLPIPGLNRTLSLVRLDGLVMIGLYLLGLIVAPIVAMLLKRTLLKGPAPSFVLELPPYRMIQPRNVFRQMYFAGKEFVYRAGTLILPMTIIIWALSYYPRPAKLVDEHAARIHTLEERVSQGAMTLAERDEESARLDLDLARSLQEQSYMGRMGKAIEPAVKPLGWDWRIAVATIASLPAREVVVSTLGVLFGVGSEDDEESSQALRTQLKEATWPDGKPLFSIPVALSLLVFFALCCQCLSTLFVMARETKSIGWPIFTFVYMTGLAYLGALITYQLARLF